MNKTNYFDNPAVVLGFDYTGLATARCLVDAGINVYGVSLDKSDIGRWSNCGIVIRMKDDGDLVENLARFFKSLPAKPVVIPTSDALALLLAANREQLAEHAWFSASPHGQLQEIIFKDGLYRLAYAAGVQAPAQPNPVDIGQVEHWCVENPPPYLLKPYYQNIAGSPLDVKNKTVLTAAELMIFMRDRGFGNLVVQQLREGGDGNVYDCYGACDNAGTPLSLTSHRRIRQYSKDFGATCYGEIPLSGDPQMESRIFSATRRLLNNVRYHGIFGIEWLHDVKADELLLIDFNARPFSSIGHLKDCGLNLPLLNFLELTGQLPEQTAVAPPMSHKYWVHFSRDLKTLPIRMKEGSLTLWEWLSSIARARSYAIWSVRDPLPSLVDFLRLVRSAARHGFAAIFSSRG